MGYTIVNDNTKYILDGDLKVVAKAPTIPVANFITILQRDIDTVFTKSEHVNGERTSSEINFRENSSMDQEEFNVQVEKNVTIIANSDLGYIYGMLYISHHFLKIEPFWFWLDQRIEKRDKIEIDCGIYTSKKPIVKYRGWFFNDEVLIAKWKINNDETMPWRMAFEALLRCGGNLCIPGTDKNSRKYRKLASDYGLWITHHHAEPLGAEMFVRAYPNVSPNYFEQKERFFTLWEDAVREQKDYNVIWNVGFRGQGDCPFWSNDSSNQYDTDEKRGKLISNIIKMQQEIVRKYVADPIFCTNLYGEVMELYEQGYIELDNSVIKVSADNGYGKMVTRRRDNHCARISSLLDHKTGKGGIYYHVSFYDLQAANHITMLPNSVDFVNKELSKVLESGADEFWIINSSNVRPHTYYLDAVRKKWFGETITDEDHSKDYVSTYYDGAMQIARCFEDYSKAMPIYGENEDEHCGEQFYTENVRILAHQLIIDASHNAPQLKWVAGEGTLLQQAQKLGAVCEKANDAIEKLYEECNHVSESLKIVNQQRFNGTISLQVKLHHDCLKGMLLFVQGIQKLVQKDYKESFYSFGLSKEMFDTAYCTLRNSEYGVWDGFYANDCFADVLHTAYMVEKTMGYVRELGDNVRHDKWYRESVYPVEDQQVFLLLVIDQHMTDLELFQAMKAKREA